ncbi:MAG: hypothetical protein AB4290_16955 [Spirulina sp.]
MKIATDSRLGYAVANPTPEGMRSRWQYEQIISLDGAIARGKAKLSTQLNVARGLPLNQRF